MKTLLLGAVILLALVTTSPAQPVGHNGSLMEMAIDQRTGAFTIVYAQPKPSLLAIGVTPGVLLIRGQMSPPNLVQAIAHVYDLQCGAVPYPVAGRYDGPVLILEGPAPVVWARTCIIAEYIWTHNSFLRFDLPPRSIPMKYLSACVLLAALATPAAAQNQTTFRDASGRTTGTVTTDSNGTKTFRDASGRTTGTATTNVNSATTTTTFRDGSGRTTGTATRNNR